MSTKNKVIDMLSEEFIKGNRSSHTLKHTITCLQDSPLKDYEVIAKLLIFLAKNQDSHIKNLTETIETNANAFGVSNLYELIGDKDKQ